MKRPLNVKRLEMNQIVSVRDGREPLVGRWAFFFRLPGFSVLKQKQKHKNRNFGDCFGGSDISFSVRRRLH